jgi:hypothetical protein
MDPAAVAVWRYRIGLDRDAQTASPVHRVNR